MGLNVRHFTVLGASFLILEYQSLICIISSHHTLYNLASCPVSWAQPSFLYLLPKEDILGWLSFCDHREIKNPLRCVGQATGICFNLNDDSPHYLMVSDNMELMVKKESENNI